jgi:class 3 adenylate cyclase/tetratricopeptide (TPR) repeat protein
MTDYRSDLTTRFAAYLCEHHLRQIQSRLEQSGPVHEQCYGAILLVDISGFTELTSLFAARGAEGAEQLSRLLDQYFGRMTRQIAARGGDIVGFAGDAAVALWSTSSEDGLAQAALCAAAAGLDVQEEFRAPFAADAKIVQRAGVGVGTLSLAQLGGVEGNWAFLAAGQPILQAGRANKFANPGEVVISPEVWDICKPYARGMSLASGDVRLEKLTTPAPAPIRDKPLSTSALPRERIIPCVPRIVAQRLTAGHDAWLGEFRTLTVMFMHLTGVAIESTAGIETLNRAVEATQRQLSANEGFLYQILMDDKGLSLLAVFGFPPFSHEDDPARAVRTSLHLHREFASLGVGASTGITTGRAFCGSYGSEFRQQYSAVGRVMNLGARLMQAASGSILVDEATRAGAATAGIAFDPPRRLHVKGLEKPLAAHSPSTGRSTIVNRVEEQAVMRGALDGLVRERRSSAVVLEGEPGIGKSKLLEKLQQSARDSGVICLSGAGDPVARSTPYHAWRGVFRQLFRLDALPDDLALRRRHVLESLSRRVDLEPLAPLLNSVLDLQIPDNELTAQMTGQVRAENTGRLLAALLQDFAQTDPLLITIEDAHWADSASWGVEGLVARTVSPDMIAISLRPMGLDAPPEFQQLLRTPGTIYLELRLLSFDEIAELLRRRLNVESLPPAVTSFIHRKSGGQPLFAEELAQALRDAGLIRFVDGVCELSSEAAQDFDRACEALQIPGTIQGVVTARIDRLDPAQQMALKVASIIGFHFSRGLLHDIYPMPDQREQLPSILEDLNRRGMIHPIEAEMQEFAFRHVITQEVVYAGVAFGNRRDLHRAVAEWYETTASSDLDSSAPLLAYHWRRGGEPARALPYAIHAGENALNAFANAEAIRFLEEALELESDAADDDAPKVAGASLRRAHCDMLLGKAYVNLSRHSEGRKHLERGLAHYGSRVPSSSVAIGLGLISELVRQIVHRFVPAKNPATGERIIQIRECAAAYEGLVEILYLQGKPLPSLLCALKSLNLAEKAGPTPETARGLASFGALCGFIPLRSSAESYFRMAVSTAEQLQDLPALTWVLLAMGVYDIGAANFERAASSLNRGISIAAKLGDSRRGDDLKQSLACLHFYAGDIAGSVSLLDEAQRTSSLRGDARLEGEVVRWKCYALLLLHRFDELLPCLDELERLRTLPSLTGEVFLLSDVNALRSAWQFRSGKDAAALESAREAARRLLKTQNTFHDLVMERVMIADVFIGILEKRVASGVSASPAGDEEALRKSARDAVRSLASFSRIFPIASPFARIAAARLDRLSVRAKRSESECRAALADARRIGMPWPEGIAQFELARCFAPGSAERNDALMQAREIFEKIGLRAEFALREGLLR